MINFNFSLMFNVILKSLLFLFLTQCHEFGLVSDIIESNLCFNKVFLYKKTTCPTIGNQPNVEASIEVFLKYDRYPIGSPINIGISIANKSNSTIYLRKYNSIFLNSYNVFIQRKDKKAINLLQKLKSDPSAIDSIEIKSHSVFTDGIVLNYFYDLTQPGDYSLTLNANLQHKDGSKIITSKSNILSFKIPESSESLILGEKVAGFQLGLQSKKTSFSKNEEIEVKIIVLNSAKSVLFFQYTGVDFEFELSRKDGKPVSQSNSNKNGMIRSVFTYRLVPKEKLDFTFKISELLNLKEAGAYYIKAKRKLRPNPNSENRDVVEISSNVLQIIVNP